MIDGRQILIAAAMSLPTCTDVDPTIDTHSPDTPPGPFECGLRDDGTYEMGCIDGIANGRPVSGLCDEPNHTCIPMPTPKCSDGWCEVPAGSTMMSRMYNQVNWLEYPWYPAYVTRPFLMQQTEVTVRQWLDVMGGERPGRFDCGLDCPVSGITLFDVIEFANRVSANLGLPTCYTLEKCDRDTVGRECEHIRFAGPHCTGARLPSEVEWELAAGLGRGACILGSHLFPQQLLDFDMSCSGWPDVDIPAHYCGSPGVSYAGCADYTEFNGPACAGPIPVAQYPPNPLGLYDLHGNIREYTHTVFTWAYEWPPPPVEKGWVVDPGHDIDALDLGGARADVVGKGGGFGTPASHICAFSRAPALIGRGQLTHAFYGFRLIRTLAP